MGKKSTGGQVVYISKTANDDDPVEIWKLAGRLKGVAHVLVEESTSLNPLSEGFAMIITNTTEQSVYIFLIMLTDINGSYIVPTTALMQF